jgi:hypothetical protein
VIVAIPKNAVGKIDKVSLQATDAIARARS